MDKEIMRGAWAATYLREVERYIHIGASRESASKKAAYEANAQLRCLKELPEELTPNFDEQKAGDAGE